MSDHESGWCWYMLCGGKFNSLFSPIDSLLSVYDLCFVFLEDEQLSCLVIFEPRHAIMCLREINYVMRYDVVKSDLIISH